PPYLAGLTAQATAQAQQADHVTIPAEPTPPISEPRLSILPISLPSPGDGASEAPTTIGRITGSAPPPSSTVGTIVTTSAAASSSSSPSSSPSSSSSSSTASASKTRASSTATQSQTSNPAAAPTLAHYYVAGVIALAGLAVAL
ncbi:hypothetical protein E4U41_002602, partial [Claviceps citrina]